MAPQDYSHSDHAQKSRESKATALARYLWDRDIDSSDLESMTPDLRRKLARAASINPPSTNETWTSVARMLDDKASWAAANPAHPSSARAYVDEKIMWVKPPITPWSSG
ncbi:hypothetical protein GCM10007304_41260 [Rhodococcoides trifolii]|uniref:Uncharacterized protein n=1 Tax=Rhodococcoides trifolii TaxID=908250 RepID=A0A917G5T9_9NOCA|nr:hypothetical protein [Rhodococcus trifolii]GGG23213.1 hypothetical protein GCM10007304_41260 [Rhodococcus trifolii]